MANTTEIIENITTDRIPNIELPVEIRILELEEESQKVCDQVEKKVFEEIKKRIKMGDPNALSVLISAKEAVKNIKYTLIALKPFYLMYIIGLLSQKPDSI